MTLDSVHKFTTYCIHRHDVYVNQKYGDSDELLYSFHLDMVSKQHNKFRHLLLDTDRSIAYMGTYGHDLIEDGRIGYDELKNKIGRTVADIVYCCTDEKGHTRGERHSDKFFEELNENELAIYVKLCDVIANVLYSILSNSTMGKKYKKEYPRLKEKIYREKYKEMFDYLEHLFELIK